VILKKRNTFLHYLTGFLYTDIYNIFIIFKTLGFFLMNSILNLIIGSNTIGIGKIIKKVIKS